MSVKAFREIAAQSEPRLDELALSLAAELRGADPPAAFAELDRLGAELAPAAGGDPEQEVEGLRDLLGRRHGFAGDREDYYHPRNSMLDLVLERRRGLPILLSIVYVEVARRAGIELSGVGLPGHYVVGHFGREPPLLIDPFDGGAPLTGPAVELPRPDAHETALRMLNNLVEAYLRRMDLAHAIRAAELRLELPLAAAQAATLGGELASLRARLN